MKKNSEEKVKLSTEKKHETNPFMVNLKGKMFLQPRANMIIAKGERLVNTETGEILKENTLIGRRKVVDKSQFAKIYASEIATLYDLSKSAQNVFLHLTKVMDYDNKAYFNYLNDYTKLGYKTKKSPYNGITELIRRDIIAAAIMPHYYWMNPTIVCKGERFAKYTEYLTEEEAQREQEYLLKKQGEKFIEKLPEEVESKYKKAGEQKLINEENRVIPFEEESPFSDPSQTNLLDQINEINNKNDFI